MAKRPRKVIGIAIGSVASGRSGSGIGAPGGKRNKGRLKPSKVGTGGLNIDNRVPLGRHRAFGISGGRKRGALKK